LLQARAGEGQQRNGGCEPREWHMLCPHRYHPPFRPGGVPL
jgi:hypothetical protein